MPTQVTEKLINWASDIEPATLEQAATTSRLSFVHPHVALMPDAHWGTGSTVGSVVPTSGAIIPACVGVDIGCGMVALETSLSAVDLPDDINKLMPFVEQAVPAGMGQGHESSSNKRNAAWHKFTLKAHPNSTSMTEKQSNTAFKQFGSLGGGNHFVEVCLDERDVVWVVLHSGSRGIGNQLALIHMKLAESLMKDAGIVLEDKHLAYLRQGTPEFEAYINDMLWSQDYAFANRQAMLDALMPKFYAWVGAGSTVSVTNCHHNFCQQENHGGERLWITRKGAIKADVGDRGVIPGSMGTKSYIVSGLGNAQSFNSCSHGAGRRMGRKEAERRFKVTDLAEQMAGIAWNQDKAEQLLDEIPSSYKDIDAVMEDQQDLVRVEHTLRQILNYKGTK